MADLVNTNTIRSENGRYTEHFQNASDGTGESSVTKVDVSAKTSTNNAAGTYTVIDRIDFSVWGFNYVTLYWDATTDDEIATLFGQGAMDWSWEGGFVDPQSSGTTGDIKLTTDGGADGSGYDITIRYKVKSA